MRKTFKFRLYPTKKQEKALQLSLDACRWVYNKTLELRKNAWEQENKSISRYDTSSFLPKWKEENPKLENAFSQCLQNVQLRVELAFRAFFKRVKNNDEKPGYPRFKGVDRYDSFTFPQSGFDLIENKLRIAKVGIVRVKKHREIKGKIKTLTVMKKAGKWYACFSCEILPIRLYPIESVVGIDVGLESFATFSTGEKIPNPRFFRTDEAKLVNAQRRLSKAEKGSPDRRKQRIKVAHIHEKTANRRSDFAHKLSRRLINENQIIVFENLEVQKMRENGFKGIRKSIGDVAWTQFMGFTDYKAEEAGRQILYVNPRNTSKRCSKCGRLVEKSLSDRVHSCSCGLVLDRDHNAAINILALGMQDLAKSLNTL